jgi:hypothetical protein
LALRDDPDVACGRAFQQFSRPRVRGRRDRRQRRRARHAQIGSRRSELVDQLLSLESGANHRPRFLVSRGCREGFKAHEQDVSGPLTSCMMLALSRPRVASRSSWAASDVRWRDPPAPGASQTGHKKERARSTTGPQHSLRVDVGMGSAPSARLDLRLSRFAPRRRRWPAHHVHPGAHAKLDA